MPKNKYFSQFNLSEFALTDRNAFLHCRMKKKEASVSGLDFVVISYH